ncbi:MAG TPA: D-cysteine desulfhydrase family protein [Rhodospirillaceae bacterium]|nr:D-cysteine desulfhydrase family protein [Rhodospirillaceae bacterium]
MTAPASPSVETVRIGNADFPRRRLISGTPPLERLANLSGRDGRAPILVKRDDLTGLGLGGNKVRKLEFYTGQALAQGCDTLIITGAVQSNYVRVTAAAAFAAGLDCHIQLEDRVAGMDAGYRTGGNVLLDRMFGATLHHLPAEASEADADAGLDAIADALRAKGRNPYVIHLGAAFEPRGALGYILAAREILDQIAQAGVTVTQVVIASGSGQTHSGLLTGLRLAGSSLPVTGVCVRRDAVQQQARITQICGNLGRLIGRPDLVGPDDIVVTDRFLGPGYGKNSPETWGAFLAAARQEGLLLDPVYTSKSFAGALAMADDRDAMAGGAVLYLHTGGLPALFAYEAAIDEALAAAGPGPQPGQ